MARSITRGLAPILEKLELERPQVVTLRDLEKICAEENVGTEPRIVASRLKKAGWLLPTGKRGVWEFAPAELAGSFSSYDPLLPVKAISAADPSIQPLLRGQTAAWAMGLADRVPSTIEIVLASSSHNTLPTEISACTYKTTLQPTKAKDVFSLAPEAILIQMAERPSTVRSWGSAAEWLFDVMAEMNAENTLTELHNKTTATSQRVGYLLQGARPDISEVILAEHKPTCVARFGQGTTLRSSTKWMLVDAELPWDPNEMKGEL